MGRRDDALTRARRALSEVDGELDLARTRADALARARSGPGVLPDDGGAPVTEVEILRHGQRPTLPRVRTRVWALAAALALLGGAATGVVASWPEPERAVPGGTVSPAPAPDLPGTPGTGSTSGPGECLPPGTAVPTPAGSTRPTGQPRPSESCPTDPAPLPSPAG
ncbi:hypothetical protein ACO229_13460 [Promicromonospora sp. MS192]|uniref:hypothetical protein n=1 Tax=Promicromonospora sp. MS192 TaxID=3412684 RepID=UPI003C3031D4